MELLQIEGELALGPGGPLLFRLHRKRTQMGLCFTGPSPWVPQRQVCKLESIRLLAEGVSYIVNFWLLSLS